MSPISQLEERRQPTTTLEGWRRFIDADRPEFTLLPEQGWSDLDDADRIAYNEARVAHHSELVVVTTSAIQKITNEGQLLTLLNQREIGARRGLIVSGGAATGKTTAIKQLGRFHELRIRTRYSDKTRIPVVYVTAPPKGSARKLAMEFARFLGLPPVRRMNVTDIADAVCQVLIDARTDIVVVDEIHNLNLDTRAGEELSDHLKYFTEHLPATFVYAGIDVERSGVFTGTRGRQLAGRCGVINTAAFPYGQEWRALVAAMEGTLRLHRHEPGTLVRQTKTPELHGAPDQWMSWQQAVIAQERDDHRHPGPQLWAILAHAATLASQPGDTTEGLIPGRWPDIDRHRPNRAH